jgi:hypothetical protein
MCFLRNIDDVSCRTNPMKKAGRRENAAIWHWCGEIKPRVLTACVVFVQSVRAIFKAGNRLKRLWDRVLLVRFMRTCDNFAEFGVGAERFQVRVAGSLGSRKTGIESAHEQLERVGSQARLVCPL